jgi:hypothetical protein
MSLTVARTGCPDAALSSAKTSQSVAGHAAGAGASMPRSLRIAAIFGLTLPGWVMPVRSPLTSAMNTGTPWRLKFSASVCSVTVLPVPVAPLTRPCRFAIAGRRKHSVPSRRARRIGSAIGRRQREEDGASLGLGRAPAPRDRGCGSDGAR